MPAILSALLGSSTLRTLFLAVLAAIGGYLWGYLAGEAGEAEKSALRALESDSAFRAAVRQSEAEARERQHRAAAEYQTRIEELEHEQETLLGRISGMELAGVVSDAAGCAEPVGVQHSTTAGAAAGRLPAGAGAGGRVACYAENELRRKIAESVAVGQECDREMIRFQKLIDACRRPQ